ncbi:hypothetical protein JTE90_002337 [Oedothorax gibbosus]|uniref:Uncharacterized protein n=1 Tax=Oedothorax gibbosus TaxID=931172 RepID=A0AAV6ULQ6_9ARAC|nr:hypothetical protein JTE90_002337 [Oedothorax gibbosus]
MSFVVFEPHRKRSVCFLRFLARCQPNDTERRQHKLLGTIRLSSRDPIGGRVFPSVIEPANSGLCLFKLPNRGSETLISALMVRKRDGRAAAICIFILLVNRHCKKKNELYCYGAL